MRTLSQAGRGMRVLQLIGGIASLGFGALLCIPARFLGWQAAGFGRSGTVHADFVLPFRRNGPGLNRIFVDETARSGERALPT